MIPSGIALLHPLATASATLSCPSIVNVGVFCSVLVIMGAMSFVGPATDTLANTIQSIFATSIPSQIRQIIVGGVWVGVMTSLFSARGWSNKGHQNQTMNAKSSSGVAWEVDTKTTILQNNRLQDTSPNSSGFPVAATHDTIKRFYSSSVRYLKAPFVSWYRQPVFCHESNSISLRGRGGECS